MTSQNPLEKTFYLLSQRSNGKSSKLFEFFGLSNLEYEAVFPLTKLQRDIYLDVLFQPDTHLYNLGCYFEIGEQLDLACLKTAILNLYRHTPFWRTHFFHKDSIFCQAIIRDYPLQFEYLDWQDRHLNNECLEALIEEEIKKPYFISTQPLSRHLVLKVGKDKYLVVFMFHHLITDAISHYAFTEKILLYYKQLKEGNLPAEPTAGKGFGDYIFFNNENFDSTETLSFWREHLTRVNSLLPTREAGTKKSKKQKLIIGTSELAGIKAYCNQHMLTVPTFLKSVYGLLIQYFFAPEDDFVIFENLNKQPGAHAGTVGMYLYTHPFLMRKEAFETQTSPDDYYAYFRKENRLTARRQAISMRALLEILPEQQIKVFFNYVRQPKIEWDASELVVPLFTYCKEDEIYFFLEEHAGHLQLSLFYNELYFKDDLFLERLQSVAGQLMAKNQVVEYILDQEKAQLKTMGSGAFRNYPYDCSFSELFEAQVTKFPHAIAVTFGERCLTYGALLKKSTGLAGHLRRCFGVSRGDIVGILMDRTELTLIAMLGVFQAGAAYVPIDAGLPSERIQFMLADTNAKVVLTSASFAAYQAGGPAFLPVDTFLSEYPEEVAPFEKEDGKPMDLAYVIYTSGTTGKPKGVMIEQRGMINHLYAKIEELALKPHSKVLQNASFCFDISVWQFLAPLLAGGQVEVYQEQLILSVDKLIQYLGQRLITVLEVVPSYLRLMLSYLQTDSRAESNFFQLDYLIVTGEVVSKNLLEQWFRTFPGKKILNAYGPTEASDDITHYTLLEIPSSESVSVGRPIPNTNIYITDKHLRLCPPGMNGEICVAGVGVGRGYLNQALMTSRVFIPDAFGSGNKGRMYRTGDRGAWQPDGTIAFYGRKDYQIKLNGHRVELQEIERALEEHPDVQEAIVVNRGKDLIGYLLTSARVEPVAIHNFLSKKLPGYMIPAYWMPLTAFPQLPSGKTDRSRLPVPLVEAIGGSAEGIEHPQNEMEKQLLAIWQQVLEVNQISVSKTFFDMGGNSMKLIALHIALTKVFSGPIAMPDLFRYNTIRQFSSFLLAKELTLKETGIDV